MTVPNDKLDLIIEMIRQQDKRFDEFKSDVQHQFEGMQRQFDEVKEEIRESRGKTVRKNFKNVTVSPYRAFFSWM